MSTNESIKQITKLISALSSGRVEEVEEASESFASECTDSEELKELQQEVLVLARKHLQAKEFILNLSEGNLEVEAPQGNRMVDPLKELQANLRHLVWQTREIAQGDYSQKIDFLGDFSTSFNSLVNALVEKEKVEEALSESEFFFKESQRAASIGSYKADFITGFWESSEILDQIFGIDKDYCRTITGWIQIIHPDNQEMMNNYLIEEVIANHQPFDREYRIIRQNDGEPRWVHGLGNVDLDAEDKVISLIGTIQDITDRKLAEYTLQKSEEKYRDIFDNSIEAIFQTTLSGQLQIINPAFAHLFGYESPDEMITEITNIKKQLYANSEDRYRFVELLLKNGFLYDFEVRFKRKDGSLFWVSINSRLVKNEEGVPLYLEGTFIDITKRKQAEEVISTSEVRLKRAELASRSGNWEYHLDSQTIYASEGAKMVYGLNVNQVDYSFIQTIPLPEYRPLLNEVMKKLIEENIPYDIEFKIRSTDIGLVKDIHSIATFDNKRRIVFGVIQDITDRKRIEEALRESQFQLSNAIKMARLGSWEYDIASDLYTFSDSFYAIFKTTANEIGTYTMSSANYLNRFVYPEDIWIYDKEAQKSEEINDTNFSRQIDHRILFTDGEVGYISVRYFVLKDENGKTIKTYGVSQDITERIKYEENLKKSEAELREINAAKDKFFSIIAHDLKSPFNSILGLSNLLVEQIQEKNTEGIEEYANIIQNSSQRAMDLLMNLLEWSRSQTGRMEFSPEYVEMVVLINVVLELLSDSAKQKSIAIRKELPRNMLVFVDKAMISTILRNLISNAIKFTRMGGQIVISAELKNTELIIAIRDNGVGIKKENIEKLFRIDENHSTLGTQNEKGTGLGLILCKEFIEKHDGKIWVESEVGKGSKFSFSIPKRLTLIKTSIQS